MSELVEGTLLTLLMSRNARDDKNGRLTMLVKLAILAIFCQFRQISLSIRIDTTWVNIGDFGKISKIAQFWRPFANFWRYLKSVRPDEWMS